MLVDLFYYAWWGDKMSYAFMTVLAVAGGFLYTLLNVIIRRYVANVRSREDYDEDVDGKMTASEKEASIASKAFELEKKKVGFKEVFDEKPLRFAVIVCLGVVLNGLLAIDQGLTPMAFVYFLFFALLTIIAFVDLDTMEIPPSLNYIILGLGIISIFLQPEVTIVQRLIGFVCVSGFLLLLTILIPGAFGGGDIKLMAAAGFLLGWKGILTGFIIGLFVGAAIGALQIAMKQKGGKEHMPFGPSLCIGLVAAVLYGHMIIEWYWNIIKMSMPNTYGG